MVKDQKRYFDYIQQDLVESHGCTEEEAKDMVNNLGLDTIMKEHPDHVMHENVEYWSKWLIKVSQWK